MKKVGFDRESMTDVAGCRAIWLLYRRGHWGFLEDLGMVRDDAEPALQMFERYTLVGNRLTKPQCRMLIDMVPGFREASVELRLGYALKEMDKHENFYGNNIDREPERELPSSTAIS